ncbi:MAG TPA: hypothetical protein PLH48_08835 [Acinetobacter johnsonii]|nr:hypothetical protein [Acinetobacter johnsonii]
MKKILINTVYVIVTVLRILYFIPFLRWFAWIYAWGCVFMAFVSWQIPSMAIDRDYMTLKAIVVNVFIWLCILSAHIPWHPKTEK